MPRGRQYQRGVGLYKWLHHTVTIGSILVLTFTGCKRESLKRPEAVYAGIEKEFLSGDLSKAQQHSEEAYRYFESSRPDWAATFRLELAKVLIYQGKSHDSLELLQQPLPVNSTLESEVNRKIFRAIAESSLGHFGDAEKIVAEAEHQCPDGAIRGEVFGAEGIIYIKEGKLDDAERVLQVSLADGSRSGDQFLQTRALMNLGVVALQEEHYEDALALFGDASILARLIGAKLPLEKAVGNLGWIYYRTGDFQRSLINFREVKKQAAELGSAIDQVRSLNDAGLSEYRLGNVDAARLLYEQSLTLAQSITNREEILDAHAALGFLLLRLNHPDAVEAHIQETYSIVGTRRYDRAGLRLMLLEALLSDKRGDKQTAIKTLLDLHEHAASAPSLQWETESTLAHLYMETGRPEDADRWFQRSIETFRRQRSSLKNVESTLPFLENANDIYADYTEFLVHQHRPDEALNVVDASRAEALADGLHLSQPQQKGPSSQRLNARTIAARMQATILVYSLRPKTSYLWVVTPARQQFYQLSGSETIVPLIQLHTKAILASKDLLSQPAAPGQSLYNELVKPAEGLIKKGGRVFIIGDDALSGLNFETLQTPGDGSHYWIEDVTITNAKSLQLLSVKQAEAPRYADRRILLMGDPVYQKNEFAELPNASTEIKDVASHFSSDHRTILTAAQASPEAYQLSHAGQFSYIHFVAHGTANMTIPLDSAVVLSGNREDATVYKLYARDILKQNLNADLVTVSACNGSGVRNYSGEGLVGLAWAFLRAGSHNVIGAMWEVSDVSTPLLMDHLYGELAKGSQPDAALRSAKLAMIHSDGVFRKPLYWAAFQLYSGA
jgi:CHAT domain-containing protein/Flp pilus assembly protein TadD